jgi:hypothetical protein
MMPPSLFGHCHCRSRFSRRAAGFARSCARLRNSSSTPGKIGIRKRRPDMLSIISHARTSGLMLAPDQLRSNRAAKTP